MPLDLTRPRQKIEPPEGAHISDSGTERQRLLSTGKRLFARLGYESTTVSELCRDAHVSQANLLRLFDSKLGLLEAIFDEGWESINPRITDIVVTSLNARQATLSILAVMTHIFERDPDLAKLMLFEGRRPRADDGGIMISDGFRKFFELGMQLVIRGQRDGSYTKSIDPHILTSVVLGAVEA